MAPTSSSPTLRSAVGARSHRTRLDGGAATLTCSDIPAQNATVHVMDGVNLLST